MVSLYRAFTGMGRRELLNWLPDEMYLRIMYFLKTKRKLNIDNPRTFNEKMQWIKINCHSSEMTMYADKYRVKQFIANTLGEKYVIPTIAVWKSAEEIDEKKLPEQFVLKCNHDSGSVIVCRDKGKFDFKDARERLGRALQHTGFWYGREWPYKDISPCIIAETYLDSRNAEGLMDYKFFCFNGKPEMLYASIGLEHHPTAKISFFDLEGNELPFHRSDYQPLGRRLDLPDNYDEMLKIAERLASQIDVPFVRIDLYSVDQQIYFSEVTFFPCNGVLPFEPQDWDEKLGERLILRT